MWIGNRPLAKSSHILQIFPVVFLCPTAVWLAFLTFSIQIYMPHMFFVYKNSFCKPFSTVFRASAILLRENEAIIAQNRRVSQADRTLLMVVVKDLLHIQQLIGMVYMVLQKINKVEEVERGKKEEEREKE